MMQHTSSRMMCVVVSIITKDMTVQPAFHHVPVNDTVRLCITCAHEAD